MTMIQDMLETWTAWLIPYLIVNDSASVDVILTVWWMVLAMVLWPEQTCNIDVVTLFLILVSEMTMIVLESDRMSSKILLSLWR